MTERKCQSQEYDCPIPQLFQQGLPATSYNVPRDQFHQPLQLNDLLQDSSDTEEEEECETEKNVIFSSCQKTCSSKNRLLQGAPLIKEEETEDQVPLEQTPQPVQQLSPTTPVLQPGRSASPKMISMPLQKYERFCQELKCPICKNLMVEPVWLPCMHVFCHTCIRSQVVKEKTRDKLARCAECKMSFSHRAFKRNKKFENIIELFTTFREENNMCTQVPESFPLFNPLEMKRKLLAQREQRLQAENDTTRGSSKSQSEKSSKTQRSALSPASAGDGEDAVDAFGRDKEAQSPSQTNGTNHGRRSDLATDTASNNAVSDYASETLRLIFEKQKELQIPEEQEESDGDPQEIKKVLPRRRTPKQTSPKKQAPHRKRDRSQHSQHSQQKQTHRSTSRKQTNPKKKPTSTKGAKASGNPAVKQSDSAFEQEQAKSSRGLAVKQSVFVRKRPLRPTSPELSQTFQKKTRKCSQSTSRELQRESSLAPVLCKKSQDTMIEVTFSHLLVSQVANLERLCNIFSDSLVLKRQGGGAAKEKRVKLTDPKSKKIETTLIVENAVCPLRTAKVLVALCFQIPIIGYQWAVDCIQKRQLLQYDAYRFKYDLEKQMSLQEVRVAYSNLFSSFTFFFPSILQFQNHHINRSGVEIDQLKVLIRRCGGQLVAMPSQMEPGRVLLRIKCNPKFSREDTDFKIATLASKNKQDNLILRQSPIQSQKNQSPRTQSQSKAGAKAGAKPPKIKPARDDALDEESSSSVPSNQEFEEAQIDFHWITDSVYVAQVLPLAIYLIEN